MTNAQEKMVCLGMDCLRLALGMAPVNFNANDVRDLINLRIDQYHERQAGDAQRTEERE